MPRKGCREKRYDVSLSLSLSPALTDFATARFSREKLSLGGRSEAGGTSSPFSSPSALITMLACEVIAFARRRGSIVGTWMKIKIDSLPLFRRIFFFFKSPFPIDRSIRRSKSVRKFTHGRVRKSRGRRSTLARWIASHINFPPALRVIFSRS